MSYTTLYVESTEKPDGPSKEKEASNTSKGVMI